MLYYDPPAYSSDIAAPLWPQTFGDTSWPDDGAANHVFNDDSWQGNWVPWGKRIPWASESLLWHQPASHLSHFHLDGYDSWSDNSSSTDAFEPGHHQCADSYDEYGDLFDSRLHQATRDVGQSMLGMSLPQVPADVLLVNSHRSGAYESLCTDASEAELVAFDAEWAPDYAWGSDNPISVLQLAFPISRRVYVIQLERLDRRLPKEVQMMLVNPEVRKIGFAVDAGDRAKMARSGIAITPSSITDVQVQCAAALGVGQGAKSLSLKSAANGLLGFDLKKDKRITCSDWSIQELTPEQVWYAALDAWVTLRLSLHR